MKLDLTITLGNVIQVVVLIGAIYLAYSKIRERLVRIETRLAPMWKEFTNRRVIRRPSDNWE